MSIPDDLLQKIKVRADEQHPDDYDMQLFYINEQSTAFLSLCVYKDNFVDNEIFDTSFNKATSDWPDNYEMQITSLNNRWNLRSIFLSTKIKMSQKKSLRKLR